MRLIPRALRPTSLLRRQTMRRGVRSESELIRMLAFVIVGRPEFVRRQATRQGLMGSSRLWRALAYGFIASDVCRKLAVKQPERLGTERLGEGQGVTVLAMHRPTRRERRRAARAS
jgi:hypothetical protein